MKLTTDHSASSYRLPVFVDSEGNAMDYPNGLRALRKERKWTVADLAEQLGASPRTVEGWEQGRMPSKAALILLSKIL